jgi:HD-like signal output (HDOD) protein/ActR/RegA family two-component response regulator
MALKILFVDDDPHVLAGLRRMLHGMRHEWETAFVPGGREALELLDREPFDLVITDMRMPGMDGAQLLEKVKKRHPEVVRIILSGHSDKEMVLKSVRSAHQYLSKPCDPDALKTTIKRTVLLREVLRDEGLRLLVGGMETLPSLPDLYLEIMRELKSETSSMRRIGEIISRDVGMTAKVLQLVNSAFFGQPRHIANPVHAVELLGLETIRALVLSIQIFAQFDLSRVPGFSGAGLWDHSLRVGVCARNLALWAHQPQEVVDDAFLAGVLHDAGKLILAGNFPKRYQKVVEAVISGSSLWCEEEQNVFEVNHAQVGAYLFSLWGFSYPIVEAVAFHHEPGSTHAGGFTPLTAVHVANGLVHQWGRKGEAQITSLVDTAYLETLGLAGELISWQEKCRELLQKEADHE